MQTLKQILKQNHGKKTKKELIDLLTGLKNILGADYEKVTGIQVNELSKTKKEDLLAIINDFESNYNEKWENGWAKASTEIVAMIFAQIDKDESFSATATGGTDSNFAAELGGLDFANLIGGPLEACVTAQTNASLSTVSFIEEVGFKTDAGGEKTLIMSDFTHKRNIKNPNFGSTATDLPPGTDILNQYIDEKIVVKVPFISLLNVPSLRIETCDIDFNVKLNSVFTAQNSSSFGVNANVSGKFWRVKFSVSASYKRSSSSGIKVEKEYTMGVKVRATNDEMPAGLEKVLGILAG